MFSVPPGRARACPDDPECDIPQHSAFISVDANEFNVANVGQLVRKTHKHHDVYYLAANSSISIDGMKDTSTVLTDTQEDGVSKPTHTPGNLYYLPRISAIVSAGPVCQPQAPPFNAEVATPAGRFDSYVLAEALEDFRDPHASSTVYHSQCGAKVVDWSFDVAPAADGSAQLVLLSNAAPLLKITPKPTHSGPIVIVMGNAPPGDVMRAIESGGSSIMDADPHFDANYNYCASGKLTAFPIPFRGAARCVTDPPQSYFPDWLQSGGAKIVGGFDCGPDQVP